MNSGTYPITIGQLAWTGASSALRTSWNLSCGFLGGLVDKTAKVAKTILPSRVFVLASRYGVQLRAALQPNSYHYWSKIDEHVILSAMPLSSYGHLQKLLEMGVQGVVSVVEEHEFKSGPWSVPVQPQDWKDHNITQLHLSVPDLYAIEVAQIAQAVNFIGMQVAKGAKVLVHCNAGRGRSATVVTAHVASKQKLTIAKAVECVKEKRPQIMMNESQVNAVANYLAH